MEMSAALVDVGCGWVVDVVGRMIRGDETETNWILRRRRAVLNFIRERQKQLQRCGCRLISIGDNEIDDDDDDDYVTSFRTIADLLVAHMDVGVLEMKFNERTSLLSADDETAVIQLCLAERNRKEKGVFDVHLEDVLPAKERITRKRLKSAIKRLAEVEVGRLNNCRQPDLIDAMFGSETSVDNNDVEQRDDQLVIDYESYLTRCNVVDSVHLLSLYGSQSAPSFINTDIVIFEVPVDPVEKTMLALLLTNKPMFTVSLTVSLLDVVTSSDESNEIDFELKAEKCALRDVVLQGDHRNPYADDTAVAAEPHLEKVVVAYLRLLLNTRDEIALTIALGSMTNGFSHEAFTVLRKLSNSTGSLSMYQTAMSFVLKLRLGGRSYAPDSSCPVMHYLPELLTFTTVMNKLQNVVEEEVDSSNAFKKIFTVLKLHLAKTCSAKLKNDCLQKALQNAERLAHCAIKIGKRMPVCTLAHRSTVGQKIILELRHIVNLHASGISLRRWSSNVCTLDTFSSQNSPIRFPSLLSLFKSPSGADTSPRTKPNEAPCKLKETTNCPRVPYIRNKKNSNEACKSSCGTVSTPEKGRVRDSTYTARHKQRRSTSADANYNKENTPTKSKEKPTKRCLNDALCSAVGIKRARKLTTDVAPMGNSTSRSARSSSTNKTTKPVPKGQQLITRFLRA